MCNLAEVEKFSFFFLRDPYYIESVRLKLIFREDERIKTDWQLVGEIRCPKKSAPYTRARDLTSRPS